MNKLLQVLGRVFKSVKAIIEKAKKYEKAESITAFTLKSTFTEYKINKDRSVLRALMNQIDFIEAIGLNGQTTDIVKEIKEEHKLQLELKPSSKIKKKK